MLFRLLRPIYIPDQLYHPIMMSQAAAESIRLFAPTLAGEPVSWLSATFVQQQEGAEGDTRGTSIYFPRTPS